VVFNVGTTTNDMQTQENWRTCNSTISGGSAVALTTGVAVNITSITLVQVIGMYLINAFQFAGTTSYTNLVGAYEYAYRSLRCIYRRLL